MPVETSVGLGEGERSSGVSGAVRADTMSSTTSRTPSAIASATVHSQGTFSGTIRTPGIPLPEAADRASKVKPSLTRTTAGVPSRSVKTASYKLYLVQDPQSPTASTTASTSPTHCS